MARILNKDLSRGKLWNRQCYCHNSLSCHESVAPMRQPYRLHNCDCKGKKRSWGKRTCLTAPVPHVHHQDIPPSKRAGTEEDLGLLQTTVGPHEAAREARTTTCSHWGWKRHSLSCHVKQRSQAGLQIEPVLVRCDSRPSTLDAG